jgi:hypothetical protein
MNNKSSIHVFESSCDFEGNQFRNARRHETLFFLGGEEMLTKRMFSMNYLTRFEAAVKKVKIKFKCLR